METSSWCYNYILMIMKNFSQPISGNKVNITGITTTTQLECWNFRTINKSLVGITTILDEDNMASDSATAPFLHNNQLKNILMIGSSPSSEVVLYQYPQILDQMKVLI